VKKLLVLVQRNLSLQALLKALVARQPVGLLNVLANVFQLYDLLNL